MRINVKFRETPETIKLDSVADEKALELKSTEVYLEGLNGISPVVEVERIGKTTRVTITDVDGPHIFEILDGRDGTDSGDMQKSVYDKNGNGIVDDAERVSGHTVQSDVPAGAKFTDTIYDDTELQGRVTDIEAKEADWDAKSNFSGSYNDLTEKPTIPTVPTAEISANTAARHSHGNKAALDIITAALIAAWNAKSDFSGDYNDLVNKPTIPTVPTAEIAENTAARHGHQNKRTLDEITADKVESWDNKSDFDGNYETLKNKPSIPSIAGLASETWVKQQGYMTDYTETDPTVPSWAKQASKPSYTASEVGALPDTTIIPEDVSDRVATIEEKYLPFENSYVTNANSWLTNGYTKTSTSTSNLPSECTGADRWGVLFYISENATNGTGTQMYFPIDGTYVGSVFVRSIKNKAPNGTWSRMAKSSDIPTVPTEEISANSSARHTHNNKSVLDGIGSTDISNWNNKAESSAIPTDEHINSLIDAKVNGLMEVIG